MNKRVLTYVGAGLLAVLGAGLLAVSMTRAGRFGRSRARRLDVRSVPVGRVDLVHRRSRE
jgi:hypothetical protein